MTRADIPGSSDAPACVVEAVEMIGRLSDRSTASDLDVAVALALACHHQMLAFGEEDKFRAIPCAIAGARLLKCVQDLDCHQPDWVAVHEEQCCRYGGLWIHALLAEGLDDDWKEEGLQLLARLKAINPDSQPWVPSLQDDLRASIACSQHPGGRPTVAALVNYFNDEDMLRWQWHEGFFDDYDRIYIWDGPYGYASRLPLFSLQPKRLSDGDLGSRILADPRVVYRFECWDDEAQKRISAYSAIAEDVIALHDSDEFSRLCPDQLKRFWDSPAGVACQLIENIYAGGLASCGSEYPSLSAQDLPRRWGVFKRSVIPPERHIDYLWLVGVTQQPLNQAILFPEPCCHTYHLTGCRSPEGQAGKIAFYVALALRDQVPHAVAERLASLVQADQISLEEAQRVFLGGQVGYAGVPHPSSGFFLKHRLPNPGFSEDLLIRILGEANRMGAGRHLLLQGYPLHLWLPSQGADVELFLKLQGHARLSWTCWRWLDGRPPTVVWEGSASGDQFRQELRYASGQMGHLLTLETTPMEAQAALQSLDLALFPLHPSP